MVMKYFKTASMAVSEVLKSDRRRKLGSDISRFDELSNGIYGTREAGMLTVSMLNSLNEQVRILKWTAIVITILLIAILGNVSR